LLKTNEIKNVFFVVFSWARMYKKKRKNTLSKCLFEEVEIIQKGYFLLVF